MLHPGDDPYLDERLERYDRWLRQGRIPTSSKVIPVGKSLSHLQWVLPTAQVRELLRNARSYALTDCSCRSRYRRCDNPLEVCFLLNDVADLMVQRGEARRVDLPEAEERAALAEKLGLVHLTIYNPEQHVYAICSCCPCCCHDLQFMMRFDRPDMVAHADYIAATDMDQCAHCGLCVERCVFGARIMEGDTLVERLDKCLGCGLCVTTCPTEAITMTLRR